MLTFSICHNTAQRDLGHLDIRQSIKYLIYCIMLIQQDRQKVASKLGAFV
jgi:hypothetical protein